MPKVTHHTNKGYRYADGGLVRGKSTTPDDPRYDPDTDEYIQNPITPSVKSRPFKGKSFSGRLEGFRESENVEDRSDERPLRETTDEFLSGIVERRFRGPRAVNIPEGSKVEVPSDDDLYSLPPMTDPALGAPLKTKKRR